MHAYRILLPSETDDSQFNSCEKHMLTSRVYTTSLGLHFDSVNRLWPSLCLSICLNITNIIFTGILVDALPTELRGQVGLMLL